MQPSHPIDPVNRYRTRLTEFPGRLFTFQDVAGDILQIRAIASGRRVACEFGSGSGKHLLHRAELDPEGLYFGFELRFKRSVRTIEKSQQRGIENTFLLRTDARSAPDIFPECSLTDIYVNFPDPWARVRWEKHRLLSIRLLDDSCRLLGERGALRIKTDHRDSFLEIAKLIGEDPRYSISEITEDLLASPYEAANVTTEFEMMFRSEGTPICYLRADKVGEAG